MTFTSGSIGTTKGVAVSHRSAAAFVDAEARLFLQDEPLGPGDRVWAGLSMAFEPRARRCGSRGGRAVLGPGAATAGTQRDGAGAMAGLANDITVVSTVPMLVSLWPVEALDAVRLLLLGGGVPAGDRRAYQERSNITISP